MKKQDDVKKANQEISKLEDMILNSPHKEDGISEEQRRIEAHMTARELYSAELTYDEE